MPHENQVFKVIHHHFGHHSRKNNGTKVLESVQRRDTGMGKGLEEQLRGLGFVQPGGERRLRGHSWGLQLPQEGQLCVTRGRI